MSTRSADSDLSRRERQMMDILFEAGAATGPEIQQRLEDAPSYSTVRTILRILETKGYVRHRQDGMKYVYEPVAAREAASKSALQRVLRTFFDGSAQQAVAALLDPKTFALSRSDLDELGKLIDEAKAKPRGGKTNSKERSR